MICVHSNTFCKLVWPIKIQAVLVEIKPYWNHHQEIATEDGFLLRESRIIVHKSQRQDLLMQIHAGHPALPK